MVFMDAFEQFTASVRVDDRPFLQASDGESLIQVAAGLLPLSAFSFREIGTVGALIAKGNKLTNVVDR